MVESGNAQAYTEILQWISDCEEAGKTDKYCSVEVEKVFTMIKGPILAVALRPFMARIMNAVPLNQLSVPEIKTMAIAVTIKGGNMQTHFEVLDRILACGEAGKMVNYHDPFFCRAEHIGHRVEEQPLPLQKDQHEL